MAPSIPRPSPLAPRPSALAPRPHGGGGVLDFLANNAKLLQFLAINSLLALSIYFTLACGQLSLANAAFMGMGAYASAVLTTRAGWPFPAVLLAATLAPA